MDIEASGPYGRAWEAYRRAGWAGVLALPPGRKGPPPSGFTGWAGVNASRADIQAWLDDPRLGGAANIGLHLPSGVYGLDVDHYGGKTGGHALAALVERLGPLPPTWVVSSRDDGVSGIRLYRATLPPGRVWIDEPGGRGAGIEAVHKGHRYAVVWPSVHPDTGRVYTWWHEGREYGVVPDPTALPELPAAWVEALSRPGEVRQGTQAGHDETVATVTAWREGEPCERVRRAAERAMGGLAAAAAGAALHPASEAGTWELACLGHEGHAGVRKALAEHYAGHLDARVARDGEASRREADGEWWRLVRGAVGKLVGPPAERCDCDLWSGVGVTFTPDGLGGPSSRISDQTGGEYSSSAGAAGVELTPTGEIGARDLTGWTLSPAELMARPRPEPIVPGLLYRDTLAWLIGKSGSFKSFVALDLAAAVADENGRKWVGRAVYGGPVLYVVAEGAGGMGLRVQAWTERHGPMSDRLRLLPRAVQAKSEHWPVLVELARQIAPALIVVDTQARVSVGVNENSNTEIGELIARLDELRSATRACVLVVHHIGRSGEDARGASALDGAQDTELKVERVGGPKALRVRLTVDKQKDAPDTAEMTLDLERVDLGRDELTGEALSSLVVLPDLVLDPFPSAPWANIDMLNRNQGMIIEVLRELFDEGGGTRAEIAAAWRERGGWTGGKWPKNTFYRAWEELLKKDLIGKITGTQRFRLVDPDRD